MNEMDPAPPETARPRTPPPPSENSASSAPKRLYRHPRGPLGGVAAGFAAYFDIDPVIVRLLWIVALLAGVGFPAYLVCWLVIPKAKSWPPPGYAGRPSSGTLEPASSSLISGLVIVALAALVGTGLDGVGDFVLPAALLGAGVFLLHQRAPRAEGRPAEAPESAAPAGAAAAAVEPGAPPVEDGAGMPAGSAATAPGLVTPTVLSLLALGAGVCWALYAAGVAQPSVAQAAAGGLVLVGGGLVASLWWGRAPGLIPTGLCLAALALLASTFEPWFARAQGVGAAIVQHGGPGGGWVGEYRYQPQSLEELQPDYHLGVGQLTLDLTRLDVRGASREVALHLGVGEATVIVPPHVRVEARGEVGLGEATALDQHEEGAGKAVEASTGDPSSGTLRVHFSVGMGEGTVRYAN